MSMYQSGRRGDMGTRWLAQPGVQSQARTQAFGVHLRAPSVLRGGSFHSDYERDNSDEEDYDESESEAELKDRNSQDEKNSDRSDEQNSESSLDEEEEAAAEEETQDTEDNVPDMGFRFAELRSDLATDVNQIVSKAMTDIRQQTDAHIQSEETSQAQIHRVLSDIQQSLSNFMSRIEIKLHSLDERISEHRLLTENMLEALHQQQQSDMSPKNEVKIRPQSQKELNVSQNRPKSKSSPNFVETHHNLEKNTTSGWNEKSIQKLPKKKPLETIMTKQGKEFTFVLDDDEEQGDEVEEEEAEEDEEEEESGGDNSEDEEAHESGDEREGEGAYSQEDEEDEEELDEEDEDTGAEESPTEDEEEDMHYYSERPLLTRNRRGEGARKSVKDNNSSSQYPKHQHKGAKHSRDSKDVSDGMHHHSRNVSKAKVKVKKGQPPKQLKAKISPNKKSKHTRANKQPTRKTLESR